jgi:PmbA protein
MRGGLGMTEEKCLEIAVRAVEEAQKKGADLSESYVSHSKQLYIDVREGDVETVKVTDETGLAVRLIKDNKMGFVFTTALNYESIQQIIEQALHNAAKTSADEYNLLPGPSNEYPSLDIYDPRISEVSVEEKIEIAKEIERVGRAYDPRIKVTESCTYQDAVYVSALANSRGIAVSYSGTLAGATSYFVAEENGESQTGFGLEFGVTYDAVQPGKIGEEGAAKAVRMLGAKTMPTQKTVAVFDPYIVTNFLDILAPAVCADAVQKDKSLLAGKIGQKVASELITIVDDGRMAGGIMSSPFDGEGVKTCTTTVIRNGVLEHYLYNTYTAAKEGCCSTGNGIRSSSYKGTPEVDTTNFYIEPGKASQAELIKDVNKGIYITEVMGMHTANPISGDFSVGVSGLLIENGELTTPVRGVAIAGNILELFRSVDCVANDLRFFVGKGAPTIRVDSITVSGS